MMKAGHLSEFFLQHCNDIVYHLKSGLAHSIPALYLPLAISFDMWKSYVVSKMNKRGLTVTITEDERNKVLGSACSYCGCKPAGTIDRINNNIGYISDNIHGVCIICNYLKRNLEEGDFLEHVLAIAKANTLPSRCFDTDKKCSKCNAICKYLAVQDMCGDCYYTTYFSKKRTIIRQEYDTILAKKCEKCGITKRIKFYENEDSVICVDCNYAK
jgi:hypothetical protein